MTVKHTKNGSIYDNTDYDEWVPGSRYEGGSIIKLPVRESGGIRLFRHPEGRWLSVDQAIGLTNVVGFEFKLRDGELQYSPVSVYWSYHGSELGPVCGHYDLYKILTSPVPWGLCPARMVHVLWWKSNKESSCREREEKA